MTRHWPTVEVDVAAPVVAWLRAAGWDVYQEVRQRRGERSCDIVATRGPLVWAVEAKVRLCAEVIEQAHYWSQYAHYASVAVPWPRRTEQHNSVFELALREWGLGVLAVRDPTALYRHVATDADLVQLVHHERPPSLRRRVDGARTRRWLHEEQRTYLAAGSPCGGGWSPYKATCRELAILVAAHPGVTLREAIVGRKGPDGAQVREGIQHHYHTDATAIGSLKTWVEAGKVPGVRLERDGRTLRLYPASEVEP